MADASVFSKAETHSRTSVFLLLTLQHVATALLVTIFNCSEGANYFLRNHNWLVYVSLAFYVIFAVAVRSDCLSDARPVCFSFLTMFIFAISIILSCDYITSFGHKNTVMKAVWVLAASTACLTAMITMTKCYTEKNGRLLSFLLQLVCFGIIMAYSDYPGYEFAAWMITYTATSLSIQVENGEGKYLELRRASKNNVFTVLAINDFIVNIFLSLIVLALIGIGVGYLILLSISYAVYKHEVENNKSYQIMQAINSIFGQ